MLPTDDLFNPDIYQNNPECIQEAHHNDYSTNPSNYYYSPFYYYESTAHPHNSPQQIQKPLMAYEIAEILTRIAESYNPGHNPEEIRIAAYTGCPLTYNSYKSRYNNVSPNLDYNEHYHGSQQCQMQSDFEQNSEVRDLEKMK